MGRSRIQVGKSACDLSSLTELIKGQEKKTPTTKPETWTIAGSTKCKFPHPTDHFKFAFDRNIHSSNFLFMSICSTQAAMLAERDGGRAANIIKSRFAFESGQNICESPLTPLWRCLSRLGDHQSWSPRCPRLRLSTTLPHIPFSTSHTFPQLLKSDYLPGLLPAQTVPIYTSPAPTTFLASSSRQHTSVQCKPGGYTSSVTGTTSL